MRQLLLALAGSALLCGSAFASPPTPPPPHPVTVSTSNIVTGGGTVTDNLHVNSPVGSVSISASVTNRATVGVITSVSAGYITP